MNFWFLLWLFVYFMLRNTNKYSFWLSIFLSIGSFFTFSLMKISCFLSSNDDICEEEHHPQDTNSCANKMKSRNFITSVGIFRCTFKMLILNYYKQWTELLLFLNRKTEPKIYLIMWTQVKQYTQLLIKCLQMKLSFIDNAR